MRHRLAEALRQLIKRTEKLLPHDDLALLVAGNILSLHDQHDRAAKSVREGVRETLGAPYGPWMVAFDRTAGRCYTFNVSTGERAPDRGHFDSALADAQERNTQTARRAELWSRTRGWLNTRFSGSASGSAGGSAAATQAETPKGIRSRYTRYIYELNREQLEHLLRCLPVPTYAATVEALRGAAANHFRWGGISIADIDEARKL